MRRGILVLGLASLLGAVPLVASAAGGGDVSGLMLRVQGDLLVEADESADLAVVISGDAEVMGRVGTLVVIGGTARLENARVGRLVVIRGTAELTGATRVTADVWLLSARLQESPDSRVGGSVRPVFGFPAWRLAVEEPRLAVGLLLLVLAAGWVAVAVGAATMQRAAGALSGDLPAALGVALLLFVLAPALALMLFFSVVGLPLSIAYLAVFLPALALAGFCVAGLLLGSWVLRSSSPRPYGAMLVGVLGLAAAGLIPYAGQVVAAAACALGAGALAVSVHAGDEDEGMGIPAATEN